MKKWFIVLLIIGGCFFSNKAPAQAQEKVIWDGAEIVKNQTGKMTFTKDVKVYKKDSSGNFVSMTVKRGNYFRVYDIEKYDGKVYYWMSSGYRVMATDLVVFKEVPMSLRVSFFDDYGLIVLTREGVLKVEGKYPRIKYGEVLTNNTEQDMDMDAVKSGQTPYDFRKFSIVNGKLFAEVKFSSDQDAYSFKEFIPGSDIKVVEKQSFPIGYYIATQNTKVYEFPLLSAKQSFEVEQNTLIQVTNHVPNKAVNSFTKATLYSLNNGPGSGYVSIKNLKPIEDFQPIGTYYTTKEFVYPSTPRNAAVILFLTQNDEYGIILYKERMFSVKLSYLSKTPLD